MAFFFGLDKIFGQSEQNTEHIKQEKGIIGKYIENDFPVIVRFINELPGKKVVNKFPLLVVVSWKYNGEKNNGMPEKKINERMIGLESLIERSLQASNAFTHAYSRTGNNLKEFVCYGTSQKEFMDLLNKTLAKHEEYPIEINFYEDKEWVEFKKLIDDFSFTSKIPRS